MADYFRIFLFMAISDCPPPTLVGIALILIVPTKEGWSESQPVHIVFLILSRKTFKCSD